MDLESFCGDFDFDDELLQLDQEFEAELEDWLTLPSAKQAKSFSNDSSLSVLLRLPQSILVKSCGYLDWFDMQTLQLVKCAELLVPATLAWKEIVCNTWRHLNAPLASFAVSRIKGSMLSSIDRLKTGTVSSKVLAANVKVLGTDDDARVEEVAGLRLSKMPRLEGPAPTMQLEKEAALAKLVGGLLQSFAHVAHEGEKEALAARAAQQPANIASLVRVLALAKEGMRKMRKKIVLTAGYLQELRKVEAVIDGALTVAALVRGEAPAALVCSRMPFGVILRPGQASLAGRVEVRLVCAPNFQLNSVGDCSVTCEEVGDDGGSFQVDILANDTAKFDEDVAMFKDLKFSKPSRQRPVRLLFNVPLNGGALRAALLLPSMHKFVVYSHQKQLAASYQTLILEYAFPKGQNTSWPQFANALNEVFVAQLSPPQGDLVAGLTGSDLEYIRSKYFSSGLMLKRSDVDEFFTFIGPFLFSVTHDYPELWADGYIAGFATRESVDLRAYGPGAFLLRYSTGAPGEVVVSFVTKRGDGTKHYLIREGDVSPKNRQTLAAFLWKTPNLKTMLRLPRHGDEYNLLGKLVGAPKEEVLRPWVKAQHISGPVVTGYQFHGN